MAATTEVGALEPGEFICLDATPLLTFNRIGELAILEKWFPDGATPTYVIQEEILAWTHKYPENKMFAGAAWPHAIAADTTADTVIIDQLGQFFAEGTKNVGELHVIALTHRFQGTAILDDNSARKRGESTNPPISSVFMVSMVAAAAISGLISDSGAWELQCRIEKSRGPGFALIRPEDKKEFEALLRFYRQIEKNKGWKKWPHCLHDRLLDVATISARKNQLDVLYKKSGFGKA